MPRSRHVVIQPVAGPEVLITEFEAWLLASCNARVATRRTFSAGE